MSAWGSTRSRRSRSPSPYKDGYRARLDALGLSAEDVERVVAEVKVAFRLNQALFAELGERIDDYRAA
ncbi:biliverdin-producing heme oxygenase [Nocardioides sp. TF02-7]|uniref:biliverdin-producing heme oxygenase n=1 Tax=Nocardioides sp. TF02-7 TaxID=2917724 RepID=UPI001F053C86|nr:biliverdin-producing heme oxygenase [Nocardioides sp. TF02-7]UMG93276.1 biliverdin-producing heme oxygenase [Nocardioides sp. TF02-7]